MSFTSIPSEYNNKVKVYMKPIFQDFNKYIFENSKEDFYLSLSKESLILEGKKKNASKKKSKCC